MIKKDDKAYLQHIYDAVLRIQTYVKDITYEDFCEKVIIQDAVIRQLEIIGEATKRISSDTRRRAADIPWKDIAGMRDKLIHNYLGVDIELVWETIGGEMPRLKDGVRRILEELE